MVKKDKSVQEPAAPYEAEQQIGAGVSSSALFEAVDHLGAEDLHLLRQRVNVRLAALQTTMSAQEGCSGQALLRFAGWIAPDDLAVMQEAIQAGCEIVDADEW